MGASSTLNSDGSVNEWPYYGFCSGTSFATPIVAGVCGLIKSINPCLTPAEIQYIIKSTTDPIADAAQYSGLVGTGRINAYQAVLLASDYYKDFSIENGENITWND
jgi:subtilisin family serine protease